MVAQAVHVVSICVTGDVLLHIYNSHAIAVADAIKALTKVSLIVALLEPTIGAIEGTATTLAVTRFQLAGH